MYRTLAMLALVPALVAGCGGQDAPAPAPAPTTMPLAQPDYDIPMRNFAPLTIGPYEVQPMFEEEIEDGHYNIKIEGGDVRAVRIWAGAEDAEGVMVVRTEIENDYHHGHLDIPAPIPNGWDLWIEIETPDEQLLRGSTPLREAQ